VYPSGPESLITYVIITDDQICLFLSHPVVVVNMIPKQMNLM